MMLRNPRLLMAVGGVVALVALAFAMYRILWSPNQDAKLRMPAVMGKTFKDAKTTLWTAGFRQLPEEAVSVASSSAAEDTVCYQWPPPETEAAPDETIELKVAVPPSPAITLSKDLTLYSGDIITLMADNGNFFRRSGRWLVSDRDKPDDDSYLAVEVVDRDRIRLIAENGRYLKRTWAGYEKLPSLSYITMDKYVPDPYSDFLVTSKGGNKITLQAENGLFLRRHYDGSQSFLTAYLSKEDPLASLRVTRGRATDWEEVVEDIRFDLTQLKKRTSPWIVETQTLENDSSEEQTMDFTVTETVKTTKSFEWGSSFKIGAQTKFTAGIPLVGSAEATVTVETGFTLGGSRSDEETQTFEAVFPIKCPPNTTLLATAKVQVGKMDVPYTASITRKWTDHSGEQRKYTYEVRGIFRGTNAFDLTYHVSAAEVEPSGHS